MDVLFEDIIRFTALSITILCTIYNLIYSIRQNTCSANINKLITWYVKQYNKGEISQEKFLAGMEHLKEISKLSKKDSITDRPRNNSEE